MNRRVIKKDTKSLMKRMTGTCLIIILTTVLLFAGCGSNTGSSAASSTDNQESAEEGGDMENSGAVPARLLPGRLQLHDGVKPCRRAVFLSSV